jgi:putative ABC transport system ATP-binding protein
MSAPVVIEARDLTKVYSHEAGEVPALNGVSFVVRAGEFVSIMGQSGSGKSTLLHVIGCLHKPTSGVYQLENVDVSSLDDRDLSRLRNAKIGFVFQKFNLLAHEDTLENVALPLVYAGMSRSARLKRARKMLERLGLADRLSHNPAELSGGESQRVAIARALVTEPAVILADEPTGNLDSRTGYEIMALFRELHREGRTIVQVTHDREKAEYSQRILHIKDGLIEKEEAVSERREARV